MKPAIGAAEKTRTSTGVTPQRPQRCASTNSATAAHRMPKAFVIKTSRTGRIAMEKRFVKL